MLKEDLSTSPLLCPVQTDFWSFRLQENYFNFSNRTLANRSQNIKFRLFYWGQKEGPLGKWLSSDNANRCSFTKSNFVVKDFLPSSEIQSNKSNTYLPFYLCETASTSLTSIPYHNMFLSSAYTNCHIKYFFFIGTFFPRYNINSVPSNS